MMSVTTLAKRQELRFLYLALAFSLIVAFLVVLPPHGAADAAGIAIADGDTIGTDDWGALTPGPDVLDNDGQPLLVASFSNGVVNTDSLASLGNDPVCGDGDTTIAKGSIADPTHLSPPPLPNGKSDICQVMLELDGDYLYFGLLVNSGQGDMSGLLEMNQSSTRSDGDILVALNWDGSNNAIPEFWSWDANLEEWVDRTVLPGVGGAHPSRLFGEVRIDTTGFFSTPSDPTDCQTFATGTVYSKTGGGHQGNENLSDSLKDRVDVSINLTNCGRLVIQKETVPSGALGDFSYTIIDDPSSAWEGIEDSVSTSSSDSWNLLPGDYVVTELLDELPDGWASAASWASCDSNPGDDAADSVTVIEGQTATCTLHNERTPSLTLVKDVSGGTAGASSWTLVAVGPAPDSSTKVIDAAGGGTNGDLAPGVYTLSESGSVQWYDNGTAWSCTGATSFSSTTVTLSYGDAATCTIRNTFNPDPASLTLVKDVSGGTAGASSWTLVAVGPAPDSSTKVIDAAGGGTNGDLAPGVYTLSESGSVQWYDNGTAWSCTGATSFTATTVTLSYGDAATCTIRNTFNPPPPPPPPPPPQFPNVFVAKTDLVDPIELDEDSPTGVIEYVITAGNRLTANIAATGVVVTDTLPPTTSFLSATPSKGTCAHAAGVVTCTVGTLAVGESMTINIRVSTEPLGSVTALSVLNTVSIDVNETEDTSDNADTETTAIVEVLPLEILPVTGANSDRVALVAGLLLLVGTSMVLATRRREVWGN